MTIDTLRNQFPQLSETAYGKPLVYLDNAATSLRPISVVECIKEASFRKNSNIHRSAHYFSTVATDSFENARTAVAAFVGAGDPAEIVFTFGATASLNLVSSSLGDLLLEKGDEVIVLESEHHSNIVPWQLACREKDAVIKVLGVDEYGCFSLEELESLITDRTRIFCFAHASNVLGLLNPVREAVALCRSKGVVTVVDGSQAIVHTEVDVKNLDVDFYAFSGHKIYAATGTGVLYGKRHLLEKMPPYMSGGEMISSVSWEETAFNSVPFKFEAGTPNFLGVSSLVPAIGMLQAMRRDGFESGLRSVVEYLLDELPKIDGLKLYGVPRGTFTKLPIFSFTVDGAHHEDIALLLDKMGVAVRSGQMCAEPLMNRFGVTGMVRASFAPYNTISEAEYFVASLRRAIEMLK